MDLAAKAAAAMPPRFKHSLNFQEEEKNQNFFIKMDKKPSRSPRFIDVIAEWRDEEKEKEKKNWYWHSGSVDGRLSLGPT